MFRGQTIPLPDPNQLIWFLFFFFDSSLNKRSSILFNFNCLLSDFWCSIWTKDTMRQANIFLLSSHILRAGMSECTPLVSFPLCNIPTVSGFVLLLANPGKKKKNCWEWTPGDFSVLEDTHYLWCMTPARRCCCGSRWLLKFPFNAGPVHNLDSRLSLVETWNPLATRKIAKKGCFIACCGNPPPKANKEALN